MRSILLLPLVAKFLVTIDVSIWCMFVFMYVSKDSVYFRAGVLEYVVGLCKGCDGCCVFCLYCYAWSWRCQCMGSMSVLSCRYCMFGSCVHPVTIFNASFCMTCGLLMLVEEARGDHMEEAYSRAGLMTDL